MSLQMMCAQILWQWEYFIPLDILKVQIWLDTP